MQTRLEQYIDQVSAKLSALTEQERVHEIAEIRAHLGALAAAREAAGATRDEAVRLAITQFGSEAAVCGRLRSAHYRRRLAEFRASWLGAVSAMVISYAIVVVLQAVVGAPLIASLQSRAERVGAPFAAMITIGYAPMIVPCILLGLIAAFLSGRRVVPILAVVFVAGFSVYVVPQLRAVAVDTAGPVAPWLGASAAALWIGMTAISLAAALAASRRPADRHLTFWRG
jgi:hypothetical protein